jgi:hypothetical protein
VAGTLIGIVVILFGLSIAPSGTYLMYGVYGFVFLVGLYFGIQGVGTAPTIPFLPAIPFAQELVGGFIVGVVGVHLVVVLFGVAGALVPMAYGFQLGRNLFGESVLALVTMLLAPILAAVVIFLAFWVLSAILGGILVSVGVQLTFSVADGSSSPYTDIADIVDSAGFPAVVSDVIEATGAVGQSPLLLAIAVIVTLVGVVGHPLAIKLIESRVAA